MRMAFIDDLSLVIDLLILLCAVVFYTGVLVWFEFRRKDQVRAYSHLRGGTLMIGMLGLVIGLFSVWGEITWPINGFPGATSYDLFFFDVLILLSLLLVSFAVAVWLRLPTHFVGMFSVIAGIGVLFYGVRAYQISLTLDPYETLLMYVAFGGVAILVYPATLFIDWFVVGPQVPGADPLPSPPTPNYPWIWRVLLGLFLLAVVLAGVAAVLYGINIVWSHLASAP
jgi:putative membrane protein